MSILAAIAATSEILDFTSKIRELVRSGPNRAKKLKPVVEALSVIYFTPNGLVRALQSLYDGKKPDAIEVQETLVEFNQIEPKVHEAVRRLGFDELESSGLSLRQRRVLNEIAFGKLQLRSDLQNALNQALTYGLNVEKEELRTLLSRIGALNDSIEELEEKLLQV